MPFIDGRFSTDNVESFFLADVQTPFRKTFSSSFDICSIWRHQELERHFSNIKVKNVVVMNAYNLDAHI